MAKKQRLLISLDVLLDTRLATLNRIDPQYPLHMQARNYSQRIGDFWETYIPNFPREQYDELWANRDEETLKQAGPTAYIARMIEDTAIMVEASANNPHVGGVEVVINTYPYYLTDEKHHELIDVIHEFCSTSVDVTITRIPLEELTPKRIRDNYVQFVLYSFNDWLELHHEELLEKPMPSVVCVAPALFFNKPEDVQATDIDPLTEVSTALMEFLSVEWVTSDFVSLNLP